MAVGTEVGLKALAFSECDVGQIEFAQHCRLVG